MGISKINGHLISAKEGKFKNMGNVERKQERKRKRNKKFEQLFFNRQHIIIQCFA